MTLNVPKHSMCDIFTCVVSGAHVLKFMYIIYLCFTAWDKWDRAHDRADQSQIHDKIYSGRLSGRCSNINFTVHYG